MIMQILSYSRTNQPKSKNVNWDQLCFVRFSYPLRSKTLLSPRCASENAVRSEKGMEVADNSLTSQNTVLLTKRCARCTSAHHLINWDTATKVLRRLYSTRKRTMTCEMGREKSHSNKIWEWHVVYIRLWLVTTGEGGLSGFDWSPRCKGVCQAVTGHRGGGVCQVVIGHHGEGGVYWAGIG